MPSVVAHTSVYNGKTFGILVGLVMGGQVDSQDMANSIGVTGPRPESA